MVNLVAFKPFKSAVEALEQVNAVADGLATTELLDFLELNLPKVNSQKSRSTLCRWFFKR